MFPPPILFLNRSLVIPEVSGQWVLTYVETLPDRTLWRFRGAEPGAAAELGRIQLRLVADDGSDHAWLGAISGGSQVGEEAIVAFGGVPALGIIRLFSPASEVALAEVEF